MKVINKEIGIPVCVQVNNVRYIIPGDRKIYFLPDEAYDAYKELFFIIQPPKPKLQEKTLFQKFEPQISTSTLIQDITIPKKKMINNPKGNPNWSKYLYNVIDPEGNEYYNISLIKFCKQREDITYHALYGACMSGKSYKGYKVTRHLKKD